MIRMRNNPSVVYYAGGNENKMAILWDIFCLDKKTTLSHFSKIFNSLIPSLISQYDSSKHYEPSSPPYNYNDPFGFQHGDQHYWEVYVNNGSIDSYRKDVGRFMTEYGMQGSISYLNMHRFLQQEDICKNGSKLQFH